MGNQTADIIQNFKARLRYNRVSLRDFAEKNGLSFMPFYQALNGYAYKRELGEIYIPLMQKYLEEEEK